jgi:hypothetical protein
MPRQSMLLYRLQEVAASYRSPQVSMDTRVKPAYDDVRVYTVRKRSCIAAADDRKKQA